MLISIPIITLAATEVQTVDTTKYGIKINLFDYDALDQQNLTFDATINQQINSLSPLKFAPMQNGYELTETNQGNRSIGLNTALQGIVKDTLSNGYPVLSYNNRSLDVLFNTTTNDYKRVYENVNHLFKINSNSNFVFDSDEDYAYYDNNSRNFKLYNPTYNATQSMFGGGSSSSVGFFPFNEYDDTKTNVNPQGNDGYNHFFGVTISNTFTYPENGKNGGNDMFFNFSGDDDVWVFIDDVLVLDIGGIHSKVQGSINLTTGEVSVSSAEKLNSDANTIGTSNNVNTIFSNLGKTFDRTANSKHTFNFFYLERGSTYSNMKLETNFWRLIEDDSEPEPVVPQPGKWTVKFYKDDILQNTQSCTYDSTDKKCKVGDIKSPSDDTYHIGSCTGQKIPRIESYEVSSDLNLYTCSEKEITINPKTGENMLVLTIALISVLSMLLIYRKSVNNMNME